MFCKTDLPPGAPVADGLCAAATPPACLPETLSCTSQDIDVRVTQKHVSAK